jgi:hypothetical protein
MNICKTDSLFLILFFVTALGLITGCSHAPDACATVHCLNSGACADGRCSCPPNFVGQNCDSCRIGYEGANCLTPVRSKFLFSGYNVSESNHSYSASILASNTQIDQVYLYNLGNGLFLNTVSAICVGNTITIPRQKPDLNPTYVQGSGTISSGVITLFYETQDSGSIVTHGSTSTWTR